MKKVEWTQSSSERLTIPDELQNLLSIVRREGKEIKITIEPVYQQRTANQNALFHSKIKELAAISGADVDWLKDEVKRFAVSRGYPCEIGEGFVVPKSTRTATVEQMEILIDALYQYSFNNGINLRS